MPQSQFKVGDKVLVKDSHYQYPNRVGIIKDITGILRPFILVQFSNTESWSIDQDMLYLYAK